ncbi:iron chaperone [Nonomuraea sp. NPDC052265]|uniref:iron chaperone n=1 Tax=Nonomuraea sp. NPDC052265 TaxID=3364374 RepID=UPI0037C5622B
MSTTKKTAATGKGFEGFSEDERAAMKAHAGELKKAARRGGKASAADGERDVLEKIAEMAEDDRVLAEAVHAVIRAAAPDLTPKTWYGMPAYAKDGSVVCFFKPAAKFKSRYATLDFNDGATLEDGAMWPSAFALKELTPDAEARIAALVKQAAG